MQLFSIFAIYFIIWWVTLFAVLPFGMRTQAEENYVVPGTPESAPARFQAKKVLLLTTLVAALIYGGWDLCTVYFGISMDSLRLLPNFEQTGPSGVD